MAKRTRYISLDARPSYDVFAQQERAMWEVLKPRLHNLMNELSFPDLLLACYIAGLNHMHEALEKSGQLK